ncbi:MAG TPA: hypothetical protein VFF27_04780, partial [Bacteroidia bacterium]|nr:hypothetical protein [Bacteroidia bacterium]
HDAIAIFNGMGTKGVMLAPYFANLFCLYLKGRADLPDEINCQRFIKGRLFDKGDQLNQNLNINH